MDLKTAKLFAALNQTSDTAIKALEFARESRERAEKIAAMVAAFPAIAKGDKGERGEPGQSVDMRAVDQTLKELVAKIPPAPQGRPGRDGRDGKDADIKALEERIDNHAATVLPKALETARTAAIDAVPAIVKTELAQAVSQLPKPENGKDGKDGDCACLARVWKGNWDRGTLYKPGDVFGFRGSSYVVLRECRGILPSVAVQRGPNPYYGVLAAAGAPGIANITQGAVASGTVTSVALAAPSFLTVSGSPVTTTGTLTLGLATQAANVVFAGPTSGASAAPTFRGLVVDDIPDLTSLYDEQGEADSALVAAVAYTDSEIAALSSVYQPLDADLTAIAALTTATYGRSLLTAASAGAARTSLGVDPAGSGVTSIDGTSNQVLVNGTSGSGQTGPVTLTLPQNIHSGATPEFAGALFTGQVTGTTISATNIYAFLASSIDPRYGLVRTGGSLDEKAWDIEAGSATKLSIRALNDAGTSATAAMTFTRSGFVLTKTEIFSPLEVTRGSGGGVVANLISAGFAQIKLSSATTSNSISMVYHGGGTDFWECGKGVLDGTDEFNFYNAVSGSIQLKIGPSGIWTLAPSGGTAQPWKLGNYTAGAAAQAGKVRVEINGTPYDLLTA